MSATRRVVLSRYVEVSFSYTGGGQCWHVAALRILAGPWVNILARFARYSGKLKN